MHWIRHVMYATALQRLRMFPTSSMTALEIAGNFWTKQLPWKDHASPPFPHFDICKNVLPETFDIIFLDQVLEHVADPSAALMNCHAMLKPSGHIWVGVPFLYPIHPAPLDCWRFSSQGLEILLARIGFQVIQESSGSWGNAACLAATAIGGFDPEYAEGLDLTNNERLPMVVWALAKKIESTNTPIATPEIKDIYNIGPRNALRALRRSLTVSLGRRLRSR